MEKSEIGFNKISSFKVVLVFVFVSSAYIYTSDYLLSIFITNINLLSKVQTYKGLVFIFLSAILLYLLIKRNLENANLYYQEIIDFRQSSHAKLQKLQGEYMDLFNHSPLPMWIIDIDTQGFILVNESACEIYGYTKDEYANMGLKDIRPEEEYAKMSQIFSASLLFENFATQKIIKHKKKDGTIILVKVKTTLLNFDDKAVRLASAVDVTAEIEFQQKLIETNSKLQSACEIANLGYWTNDLISNQSHFSEEIYKIFELDPKTFLLTFKNKFSVDFQVEFELNPLELFIDKEFLEFERKIVTGLGNEKWIFERQYLVKDENGKPIKLEGIAIDITKRKLYEQELLESNERFKILAIATNEAIVDWDIKNDKVIWGEGYHAVFGYDLNLDHPNLWSDNICEEDREVVLANFYKVMNNQDQQVFNAEFRFKKANGELVFVQNKGIFVRDSNGKAIRLLATMIDLTETLIKLRKIDLQTKTLMEIAWTQSHIVRAPLANLMGLVSLLKGNDSVDISNAELIEYIEKSAQKLDQIIREIVGKTNNN
ncbi:MAG: PAS domain S-box protein [bacterium]|nr:PAS domain S-box protein [bacterium]